MKSSTRTRISFQTASVRLGLFPIVFDTKIGSSLEKGESYVDTLLNIAAMNPKAMVIRCGEDFNLLKIHREEMGNSKIPIINAGWGSFGHPTQGLLDLYTIRESRGYLKDLRLLIVGDVLHSRVASSHFELAKKMGYKIAIAGPGEFYPQVKSLKIFSKLEDGLKWANVVMTLRVQKERHRNIFSMDQYLEEFGLTSHSLKNLSSDGLILHPGPINWGVEMSEDVKEDKRQKILQQVTNGVFIRQAVFKFCINDL